MKRMLAALLALAFVFCAAGFSGAVEMSEACPAAERGEGLCIDPNDMTVPVFSNTTGVRLRAYLNGVFQSAYNFTWSSSDPSVAEVDDIGNVYAVAPGFCVITASGAAGSAECAVTVVPDESFPGVESISFVELSELPYVNLQVGIGPMYGAEPVIIRRFIPSPSCELRADDPGDGYNTDNGWAFTYAVGYHFTAEVNHDYRITVRRYSGEQDHDVDVFISVYNSRFMLDGCAYCTGLGEYPSFILDQYFGGDYYVVLTPFYHPVPAGNGYVELEIADNSAYIEDRPGDVNHDGSIDSSDALLVLRFAMDMTVLSEEALAFADVSGDGEADTSDALLILRYAMGLISSFVKG